MSCEQERVFKCRRSVCVCMIKSSGIRSRARKPRLISRQAPYTLHVSLGGTIQIEKTCQHQYAIIIVCVWPQTINA